MNKCRRIICTIMACYVLLSLSACNKPSSDISSVDGSTVVGDSNGTHVDSSVNLIDKSDKGITFELSGDFMDCKVIDLDESNLNSELEGALYGFNLIKNLNNTDYKILTMMVVPNELILDPVVRGEYQYIQQAESYSLIGKINNLDPKDVGADVANTYNNGIITQLQTIFFNELVYLNSITEYDNTDNPPDDEVEQSDNITVDLSTDDTVIEPDNTEVELENTSIKENDELDE